MKKVLFAMVCVPFAVACGGDNRPPADPSTATTSTSITTETTATTTGTNGTATPTTTDATYQGGNASNGTPAPVVNDPGVADQTKDANNTKINDRDRHGALTPMDQGGGKDRDITAAIRRSVVADKGLSFGAKNVKIITVAGKVTLRGAVKSDDEKSSIEAKAKSTAGVSEVDNQLEVKK
jgi:hyperosmotically inducible protein